MPLPRLTQLSLLVTLAFSGAAQGGAVFYNYGTAAGDSRLTSCDDCFAQVSLGGQGIAGSSLRAAFFSHNYDSLFVNTNGAVSFTRGLNSTEYQPSFFPTAGLPPIIAPYFADLDTSNTGNVWYRTVSDSSQLSALGSDIKKLSLGSIFNPTVAEIITWDHVPLNWGPPGSLYYRASHLDPITKTQVLNTDTFQMILLSDGMRSYAVFKYLDQGMWAAFGAYANGLYANYGYQDGYGNNYNGQGGLSSYMVTNLNNFSNIAKGSNTAPATAGTYAYYMASGDVLNPMTNAYTWGGGSGNWAGTFGVNGGATFGGTPGTVTLSAAGFGRRLAVNSSGYTFTSASAANSLQLDNLQVATPDTAITFAGNMVLLTHAGDGGFINNVQTGTLTSGKLTFTDNSILVARDAGTVTGADIILKKNAQLQIYTAEATTRKSTLTFDNSAGGGGTLDLRGLNTTFGKVASAGNGAGTIKNSGTAPATLTMDFDNDTSKYSGTIQGAINVTKVGSGVQVLSGTNTYTGATLVNAGELRINGSASSSAFTVAQGATLSGSGTIGTLNLKGTLAPGNSPGQLNAGDTTFADGSTYLWQLNDANGAAGIGYDFLSVNGTLTLVGSGSNPITIRLQSLMADNSAGNVFNFDAKHNYSYTLATATAGISGYAANEFLLDTTGFNNALLGGVWSVGVSGNDLQLNFMAAAVPEPSSYAMMFAGLAAIGAVAQRRRKV
ncbi:PEP-CTERM sorting domain-containing protein [Pseudoduganella sp. FT26W]|uniref:PEP-CTERM sorting domain-containing protein n=1 Tax=Duganella aquatilis TaxID=2666082 RepID=A0A844DD33_9BURK|nr:nidogen-like domain-containing protein [Duganella aquatilis]MRW85850.1 PEP-CTERM sorting domain-containing protein [Duganella aquatilis]